MLSTFAARSCLTSRAYDDRKRTQGKKEGAALICLAPCHLGGLYAMLRGATTFRHPTTTAA